MVIKISEIKKMSKEEKEKKLKDLKFEMLKSRAGTTKIGSSKTKEIKKTIAKILTLNK
ncbi:50S ribosomal protein L29 [Candidatus Pacearchaeota archaeon]|nr:50S ribosomal protein L29 [Candidatus Pacearchaeota archaeon]